MKKTRWTIDETNFLKWNYEQKGLDWCTERLNRTRASVRYKADTLKLERKYFKSKYPELRDRHWLYTNYILEKKSLTQISKNINCKNQNSVRQAILKYGWKVRDLSESQCINHITCKYNNNIIVGSLLGDAGLRRYNKKNENFRAYFYKKNKFLDHIELIASHFYDNYQDRIKKEINKCNGKMITCWRFSTYSDIYFNNLYSKWYPESNNYIKLVPRDIDINSEVLLHWFLDDGSSYLRKRKYINNQKQRKKQIKIQLCTDCFSKDDQEWLCKQIKENLNLDARVGKYRNTWRIFIPQSQSNKFFDIIGPCPVKSLEYKWKYI